MIATLNSRQSWPYGQLHRALSLEGPYAAVTILKSLIICKQALHFRFVLGPTNYIAGPDSRRFLWAPLGTGVKVCE